MKSVRACTICTNCGSKKFERIDSSYVKVRCVNCNKEYKL